jgi:hypothetical protein
VPLAILATGSSASHSQFAYGVLAVLAGLSAIFS